MMSWFEYSLFYFEKSRMIIFLYFITIMYEAARAVNRINQS